MQKDSTPINWKGFSVNLPNAFSTMNPDEWNDALTYMLSNVTLDEAADAGDKLENIMRKSMKVMTPTEYMERGLNRLYPELFEKADDTCTAITAVKMPDDWNGELPPGCDLDSVNGPKPGTREHEIRENMKTLKSKILKWRLLMVGLVVGVLALILGFMMLFIKFCAHIEKFKNISFIIPIILFASVMLLGSIMLYYAFQTMTLCSDKITKCQEKESKVKKELYKDVDDDFLSSKECEAKLVLKKIEDAMGPEFAEEYQRIKNL